MNNCKKTSLIGYNRIMEKEKYEIEIYRAEAKAPADELSKMGQY